MALSADLDLDDTLHDLAQLTVRQAHAMPRFPGGRI